MYYIQDLKACEGTLGVFWKAVGNRGGFVQVKNEVF